LQNLDEQPRQPARAPGGVHLLDLVSVGGDDAGVVQVVAIAVSATMRLPAAAATLEEDTVLMANFGRPRHYARPKARTAFSIQLFSFLTVSVCLDLTECSTCVVS
jgi:hypothetical protein